MKTDKRTQLLKILSDASQSISSAALANMLGTSERTVRNYIKAINEEGMAVITSSREGYRLESHTASLDTLPNEAESRVWKVLSDLLTSKEGVNAFDEAEALYVSSSTILNTVIPQVRDRQRIRPAHRISEIPVLSAWQRAEPSQNDRQPCRAQHLRLFQF